MIEHSNQENSLPEEFKKKTLRLSFVRILAMASFMGLAVFLIGPNLHNQDSSAPPKAVTEDTKNSPAAATDQTQDTSSAVDSGSRSNSRPPSFEFLNGSGNLRKFVYHEQSKRAFVSGDVINFRLKPGGPLLGQLSKGDAVEIMSEPDQTGFLKVRTSYGQVGYVSKDLISYDAAFGVFDAEFPLESQAGAVQVSVNQGENSDELSRHYQFFLELLDKLPTKPSFDFSRSNLRYIVLGASEVLYPADPSTFLHLIHQSSFKPAVFLERTKTTNQSTVGGMVVKTKLPVRRVPANEGGQSASLQQVDISTKCYPYRMTVKVDQANSSRLELLIVDIKKSTTATLTTRPHKGDPSFTWAFADLNGDTWQDLAMYFGGQTSVSPYRFLFVAHNIDGNWQINRIEDRSGYNPNCG